MSLTERIRMAADAAGVTFAFIERETGLGRGTIRKWDINCPSADKLYRVANMLRISVDDLLGNERVGRDTDDQEWLEMIHRLPVERRYELRGYLKRMLDELTSGNSI